MIRLPIEFREFLQLLDLEKVEYLVVGGYAISLHGFARTTGDIDIWVGTNQENARALVRALRRFGFSEGSVDETMFLKENQVVRIGHPPLRIDLLTSVSGLRFSEAYSQHEVKDENGVPVRLISMPDLKQNKRSTGRPKDQRDLELLP